MNLYQGKYLIAIYDDKDRFIGCSNSVHGFKGFTSQQVWGMIRKDRRDNPFRKKPRQFFVYLIDCFEKHDDCFSEEDELFLKIEQEIEDYEREQNTRSVYGISIKKQQEQAEAMGGVTQNATKKIGTRKKARGMQKR